MRRNHGAESAVHAAVSKPYLSRVRPGRWRAPSPGGTTYKVLAQLIEQMSFVGSVGEGAVSVTKLPSSQASPSSTMPLPQ